MLSVYELLRFLFFNRLNYLYFECNFDRLPLLVGVTMPWPRIKSTPDTSR